MKREDLTEAVATEAGIPKQAARKAVNVLLDAIVTGSLKEPVVLSNFGTFKVVTRAARKARNPHTGDVVLIPQRRYFRFSPSPAVNRPLAAGRTPSANKRGRGAA